MPKRYEWGFAFALLVVIPEGDLLFHKSRRLAPKHTGRKQSLAISTAVANSPLDSSN